MGFFGFGKGRNSKKTDTWECENCGKGFKTEKETIIHELRCLNLKDKILTEKWITIKGAIKVRSYEIPQGKNESLSISTVEDKTKDKKISPLEFVNHKKNKKISSDDGFDNSISDAMDDIFWDMAKEIESPISFNKNNVPYIDHLIKPDFISYKLEDRLKLEQISKSLSEYIFGQTIEELLEGINLNKKQQKIINDLLSDYKKNFTWDCEKCGKEFKTEKEAVEHEKTCKKK